MLEVQIGQELLNRPHLFLRPRVARVQHMEEQIGGVQLLERRSEGGNQLGRELPDKADRIGEDERLAIRRGD